MGKLHIRVTLEWRKHFDAPVALVRTAGDCGDALVADEDASLYMLNKNARFKWSRELAFIPSALGMEAGGAMGAVMSEAGTLTVLNEDGAGRTFEKLVFQPVSLDVSPGGRRIAVAERGGKVCLIDPQTGGREFLDVRAPYHYVRFTSGGRGLLAVGQYGEVMFLSEAEESLWQKNFRCHTRLPALSASGEVILIPSPHFGIIILDRTGREHGVFEVPAGPKCVAVTPDGETIFVVNEINELIIFQADGKVLYRQPLGRGIWHIECDALGSSLTAAATSGSLERFVVSRGQRRRGHFVEFSVEQPGDSAEGPAVLWRAKVFSALGGLRGGQVAVTPAARHVALLDIEGTLRVFDKSGTQVATAEKLYGLQPSLKAAKNFDFVAAATSENLLVLDLRSYRQRRFSLKNEWTTHFDIAPNALFLTVADFFRGISLYGRDLERLEFIETSGDIMDLCVDGKRHSMAVLADGFLAFFSEHASLIKKAGFPTGRFKCAVGLGSGFAVGTEDSVEAFNTKGKHRWRIATPGEVISLQPTRSGLVVVTADGTTWITNAHGTVVRKMRRRARARYFSGGGDPKEIISIESQERLLTARSTDKGVLWRREMDDEITAMEISPEGAFVAILAGINLYVLATAAGEKTAEERLYLEI
ncbi:MAG: WD40 repeat domain-containing protein [Planctomycetota bacterium]|jgi:DNA-binding beta-propeller fold protein YncE